MYLDEVRANKNEVFGAITSNRCKRSERIAEGYEVEQSGVSETNTGETEFRVCGVERQ